MEDLNFNIFNIIILLGIIHGLIFSVILFLNKKLRNRTNNYLALTILSLGLSNLQYWLKDVNLIKSFDVLFIPFEFLMLPFFFFYVKSFLQKEINKYEKWLLIFPFFFFIIHQYIFTVEIFGINFIETFNLIIEYISIIFSIAIILIVFKLILNYEKENRNDNLKIKTRWLKQILCIGIILCILWFLSLTIFDYLFTKGYYKFYPLWIGMSVLIYWLAYTSIFQMNVFNQRKAIRSKSKAYSNDNYSGKNSEDIAYNKIKSTIINEKLYLNPKLSLMQLSEILNLSEGYISQVFNANSDTNFTDFINQLRIEVSKQMLTSTDFKNYTVESIGLECGFNSKSSFYTAFKKFTNKTPVQYKKDVRNM